MVARKVISVAAVSASSAAVPIAPTVVERGLLPRRWTIAGLLFCASILNYVDRQALSVLATTIQSELRLDDRDYARLGQVFLLCYAVAYPLSGWLVDRRGPRMAQTLFIAWWSVASMLTALVQGFASLALCRGLLGLGEPGNYAAAAKAVAGASPRGSGGWRLASTRWAARSELRWRRR